MGCRVEGLRVYKAQRFGAQVLMLVRTRKPLKENSTHHQTRDLKPLIEVCWVVWVATQLWQASSIQPSENFAAFPCTDYVRFLVPTTTCRLLAF